MKVKRKVLSIFLMLLIIPLFISQLNLSAAPPEDINYNSILELMWSNSSTITEGGEYHLINDEFDGNFYTIPAIATYSLTAVMGNIAAYNSVGAIYPGHSVAYEYYIFMVDQEELHFYDFKWSYKAKVPFDELVSVTTDDPLISNNTVSIQYNVDNEIYEIQIVNKGSQLIFPENPEKDNHIFVGWFLDPLFYYAFDPSTVIVNGFSLYAKFQLEDLNINYFNGDLLYTSRSVIYGENNNNIVINPSVNDYIKKMYSYVGGEDFIEYFANQDLILMNDQQWIIKQKGKSPFVSSGFKPYLDETRLQTSFSNSIKKISLTLSAQKSDTSAIVHTSIDGGSFNVLFNNFFQGSRTWVYNFENDIKHIQIWGRVITIDEIILYEGYNFSGKKYIFDKWYYDEELTLPYYEDDVFYEDTNLYAGYVEKQYELSFDSNDGSPVTSQFYYEDDEIIMPEYNPSKIGYVFAGWYLDEELEQEFNLETMPGDDVVLYAKWEETQAVQYLIEFYLDEELYTYIVIEEEQQLILPSAPPTAENQIFLGWYYDEEFEEPFKVTDEIDDDITLYGKVGPKQSGGNGNEGGDNPPTESTPGKSKLQQYIIYAGWAVFAIIGLVILLTPKSKKSNRR